MTAKLGVCVIDGTSIAAAQVTGLAAVLCRF